MQELTVNCEAQQERVDEQDQTRTPVKKTKRVCQFRAEQSTKFSWWSKAQGNTYAAEYSLCHKTASIAHGGCSDFAQRSKTESRKLADRASSTKNISKFFIDANTITGTDKHACSVLIMIMKC